MFGPKPKFDQFVCINRKERKAAIRALIAEKINEDKIRVLDSSIMDAPKTKTVANFLDTCGISGRTLFLSEGMYKTVETDDKTETISVSAKQSQNFAKSVRNLPKVRHSLVKNISGYDVVLAGNIVITEKALDELIEWLKVS